MSRQGKSNARFGSRYGSRIRKKVTNVESKYKYKKQVCPFCDEKAVERQSMGIYECKNCGKKFAGGAYEPATLVKRILNKLYTKKGKPVTKKTDVQEIESVVEDVSEE